jgi:heme-degrading monooxygenase HmoA
MAVGVLLAGPAVTAESYKQLTEHMFGNFPMTQEQSPDGLIIHSAGQSDQGYYVYDIWESQEHFQRFVDGQLGAAVQALGADSAGAPTPQFFGIDTIVSGRSS